MHARTNVMQQQKTKICAMVQILFVRTVIVCKHPLLQFFRITWRVVKVSDRPSAGTGGRKEKRLWAWRSLEDIVNILRKKGSSRSWTLKVPLREKRKIKNFRS